jgi:hypothetical protein
MKSNSIIIVKWCSHNEIQSNSEVYSSFASIYINPVIYSLLIKVAWGASVWVAFSNLLISGAKVKGRNYFTKLKPYPMKIDFFQTCKSNYKSCSFSRSVKIWSRSGMLRSTLVQSSYPVYALAWAPDGQVKPKFFLTMILLIKLSCRQMIDEIFTALKVGH